MGRFGGGELGLGSDLDVMFVHDPLESADGVDESTATQYALDVANELRRLLSLPAADPPVGIDADLRPEGRSGPLVRSLASYAAYYRRWSLVWEAQALLRARPVAGDEDLGQRFISMVNPYRWKALGLSPDEVREVRRIKARVEAERLPRGADPAMHTKLGRGGLSDVEWTAQLLQLRHAHENSGLRTTGTLSALSAAAAVGLVGPDDEVQLRESWLLVSKVRDAIILVRGRADDSLPRDIRELESVARVVGYASGSSGEFIEDYRRVTRRARTVVERVFYE
jgi:glutamate-ammonia-ligase adenylyltransferase